MGGGEGAAKIRNQRLSVTLQSRKEEWRNQEHAEERSERAIIMQYAHCRQTGGTGPSSFFNLRFQESLCCRLVSHTKMQAEVNIKSQQIPLWTRG